MKWHLMSTAAMSTAPPGLEERARLGGLARQRSMTPEQRRAYAKMLSDAAHAAPPEERSERARHAGNARWKRVRALRKLEEKAKGKKT